MTDMRVTTSAFFVGLSVEISPVGEKSTRFNTDWLKFNMAVPAGIVISEFETILLCIGGPVVLGWVDDEIHDYVAGSGVGFRGHIFHEISVRQMTVYTLCREALWILSSMYGFLPRGPEWFHGMAGLAENVRISDIYHVA